MSKDRESASPKLRFPEFDDEWKELRFSKFLKPELREVPKPKESYLAIGVRSHGRGTFQKPDADPNAIAMDSLYRVHQDDLIVNITFAWEGAIALVSAEDHGGLVSHRFPTYRFDETTVTHEFFRYVIDIKRFRWKLAIISPGGAGRNRVLSKQEFLKLEHWFPALAEQKKIAAFLNAIDKKLNQLNQERALLAAYKRGMMQRLFSQGIRFKREDGSEYPDWEKSRLDALATFSKGKGVSKEATETGGETPCVRYAELYTRYGATIDATISSTCEAPSELILSQGGEIIVPASGESAADIGAFSYLKRGGIAIGGDLNIIRPRGIDGVFLALYLRYFRRRDIARLAQGISVVHLYGAQLSAIRIDIPHIDEQRKISAFLVQLENKEEEIEKRIFNLEAFRKGIMQRMFM